MTWSLAALKRFGARAVKNFLARRGLTLGRCEGGAADSLDTYVRNMSASPDRFQRIYVLDGDAEPVRIFLGSFPSERVVCDSQPTLRSLEVGSEFSGRILLEMDSALLRSAAMAALQSYLARADRIIVRSKPGYFWAGSDDAIGIAEAVRRHGMEFEEVLQRPASGLVGPAEENVYFVFHRRAAGDEQKLDTPSAYRVAEALNHLSAPIVAAPPAIRYTGRGSGGAAAGISNPGAIATPQGIVLLARAERVPWPLQKQQWDQFVASTQPVLLLLDELLQLKQFETVAFVPPASADFARAEDFRLFEHEGTLYANHSIVSGQPVPAGELIAPEKLQNSVGISRFAAAERQLSYLGAPTIDRPSGRVEKNWAMFSSGGAVRMIYSFCPYRLFSASDFAALAFRCSVERHLRLPLPSDGLPLRNSINPIPYDAQHFLHIVHKVYPTKQYVFWAVLIDRTTLLPSQMTARPLLRGFASGRASILYACSAIVRETEVLVFGGLDDSAVGVWRVRRQELDRHWQSVA